LNLRHANEGGPGAPFAETSAAIQRIVSMVP
jgi:hypothetical protein